jgi:hypothetical protein
VLGSEIVTTTLLLSTSHSIQEIDPADDQYIDLHIDLNIYTGNVLMLLQHDEYALQSRSTAITCAMTCLGNVLDLDLTNGLVPVYNIHCAGAAHWYMAGPHWHIHNAGVVWRS